jgi:hypothetical protein
LAALAKANHAVGEIDRARQLIAEAHGIASSVGDRGGIRPCLDVAEVAAFIGDYDWAEAIVGQNDFDLVELAEFVLAAGHPDRVHKLAAAAETAARAHTDPYNLFMALAAIARVSATAQDHHRARRIANELESTADLAMEKGGVYVLTNLISVATALADHASIRRLTTQAVAWARADTKPSQKELSLRAVAHAATAAGQPDQARQALATLIEISAWPEILIDAAGNQSGLVAAVHQELITRLTDVAPRH